jgi:predicted secreted protein
LTVNTTSTAKSAQGTTISIDTGTAGTPNLVEIPNISEITGFDGKATEIDVTTLSSTAKERMLGLQDWGSVSLTTQINLKEATHAAMLAAKQASTSRNFSVKLSDGTTLAFQAFVASFPISAKVDTVYTGSISLTINGDITVTVGS